VRIALLTETFLPKVDGIVNTLCRLLEYLQEKGHQSILIAPHGTPEVYADTRIVPATAVPFPFYPELKMVLPWTNVARHLDPFQPDIVHVLNPLSIGLAGINYARMRNLPLVASYHTDIPGFVARWGFPYISDLFWTYLRWLHNRSNLNLAPSQATQRDLVQRGFNNVKIWSRGVDTTLFHPNKKTIEWRRKLTAGNGYAPLLLYVGRLSKEKRIDWLLPIVKRIPGVRLAIVGDGPQRVYLESLFSGTSTVFTGYLRGEELARAYASADIFVFPAANETFGNVILEAMASGLPVVAPRSGGVMDSVIDRYTGYLFEPEDPLAMIGAVRRLLDHRQVSERMRSLAREIALKRSWSSIMDGLLEDYRCVIRQYTTIKTSLPSWKWIKT